MTFRTYSDLFDLVESLAGVDEFAPTEASKILAFINRRLRQAYEVTDVWPRYMRLDARPAPNGYVPYSYNATAGNRIISSASRSENVITVVTSGSAFDVVVGQYVVISGLSGSVNPNGTYAVTSVSGTTLTYKIASATGTETYTTPGQCNPVAIPDVEVFMRLHDRNPTSSMGAWEYDFYVDTNGAVVIGDYQSVNGFFVTYKAVWDGPYTTASVNIPQEWFYFAAHAAYADFLRMDGQVDKALAEEQVAQIHLEQELTKAGNARNITNLFRRISTYNSRQFR